MTPSSQDVEARYRLARQQFADVGVDADAALERLADVAISIHCWQGDDIGGFEGDKRTLDGGLAVTGNYLGRASTPDQLRSDLQQAFRLIPGQHRLNLHASYVDHDGAKVDRNELQPEHFQRWIDWAKQLGLGLDFNPTYFSHPLAADGFTLAHSDEAIRNFWIEHGICCRRIGAAFGQALGTPCVTNVWIPDGFKDMPVDRRGPRERLAASLDAIFAERIDKQIHRDAVESKLFGIGSECYVVGSHEFYLGYAIRKGTLLCLDTGHFHPTENVADKVSAVFTSLEEILLHVSRGIRWDSDHVVTFNDDLQLLTQELVRGNYLQRTHIGLDFFDASINRVAAWVIGTRATLKGMLAALLEPIEQLRRCEQEGDFTGRLAMMEEVKHLPHGAVWDFYCLGNNVPAGLAWLDKIRRYEQNVLSRR